MRKLIFPFQAKLITVPDIEFAAENMRVGEVYTVYSWEGSCFRVSTDLPGVWTLIHYGRLEEIPHREPA